jgi:hypothetical protein
VELQWSRASYTDHTDGNTFDQVIIGLGATNFA